MARSLLASLLLTTSSVVVDVAPPRGRRRLGVSARRPLVAIQTFLQHSHKFTGAHGNHRELRRWWLQLLLACVRCTHRAVSAALQTMAAAAARTADIRIDAVIRQCCSDVSNQACDDDWQEIQRSVYHSLLVQSITAGHLASMFNYYLKTTQSPLKVSLFVSELAQQTSNTKFMVFRLTAKRLECRVLSNQATLLCACKLVC